MVSKKKRSASSNRRSEDRNSGVTGRVLEALVILTGGLAQERKAMGAERIQAMADAVDDLGHSLTDFPEAKYYLGFAVQSLEGFAEYVNETDFSQMVEDARVFAKRHPLAMMFIGIAGGLAATQLVRAYAEAPAKRRTASARTVRTGRRPVQTRQAKKESNGSAHANA